MGLPRALSLAALGVSLLSPVAARRGGGGGSAGSGSSAPDDSSFEAPPLEIANLAAYSFFCLVTLVQLKIASPSLERAGARIPAAGVVGTLIIMAVGYALSVAHIVVKYTFDALGEPKDVGDTAINLSTATMLFYNWIDPAIFVAVALVLHNRYRTLHKSMSGAGIAFASVAAVLVVLMVALVAAATGIEASVSRAELHHHTSYMSGVVRRLDMVLNCLYASYAFHFMSTIFLAVPAFLIRARTRNDKVMSLTLFAVVPLLFVHALSRVIFTIIDHRLIASDAVVYEAIEFVHTLCEGLSYAAAMSILVFLLSRAQLWIAEPLPTKDAHLSHDVSQGMPPAKFPGQGEYPQQQYIYVPVFPVQNPATTGMQMEPRPFEENVHASLQPPPHPPAPHS